jgi:threonine dehydratase
MGGLVRTQHVHTYIHIHIYINTQVKREDTQPVFSFKIRGAYNMIANLPQAQV